MVNGVRSKVQTRWSFSLHHTRTVQQQHKHSCMEMCCTHIDICTYIREQRAEHIVLAVCANAANINLNYALRRSAVAALDDSADNNDDEVDENATTMTEATQRPEQENIANAQSVAEMVIPEKTSFAPLLRARVV